MAVDSVAVDSASAGSASADVVVAEVVDPFVDRTRHERKISIFPLETGKLDEKRTFQSAVIFCVEYKFWNEVMFDIITLI